MKLQRLVCIAGWSLVASSFAVAGPIPALNLRQLVDESDVIVIGVVESVSERGSIVLKAGGQDVSARSSVARVVADRILKGTLDMPLVDVQFAAPRSPGTGFAAVSAGSYRLAFLKRLDREYTFTSPYYPSLPAAPVPIVEGVNELDKVANALGAAIAAPSVSQNDKMTAIHALSTTKNTSSVAVLRRAVEQPDENVRLTAAAALMVANDITGLALVEAALSSGSPLSNEMVALNLRAGLAVLTDPAAAPSLTRLMKARDDRTRRAAASALRRMRSTDVMPAFADALNDRDWEVRYYAVIALAEMTGENAWRPDVDTFRTSEDKYIAYWKERAKRQK